MEFHSFHFPLAILLVIVNLAIHSWALICYDCYSYDSMHQECVASNNCTGIGCTYYEKADGTDQSSTCLLSVPDSFKKQNLNNECWKVSKDNDIQCICFRDFCNEPLDRLTYKSDGHLPIKDVVFVPKNPFTSESLLDDASSVVDTKMPSWTVIEYEVLRANGEKSELIAINFTEYDQMEQPKRESSGALGQSAFMFTCFVFCTMLNVYF